MKWVEGYGHGNVDGRSYSFLWDRAPRSEASDAAVNREQLLQAALHDREVANRKLEDANRRLTQALSAQRLLIDEVDHRVKNNLQMVSSLIVMQCRSVADPAIRDSLTAVLERVEALGLMQRRLYHSHDVMRFDLAEFTRELATELYAAAGREALSLELELDPVTVPAEQAAPLALIINELVAASLAHTCTDSQHGAVVVSLIKHADSFCLRVVDDGVDPHMATQGVANGADFSTTLVDSLSKQLHACVARVPHAPGNQVAITVPLTVNIGARTKR